MSLAASAPDTMKGDKRHPSRIWISLLLFVLVAAATSAYAQFRWPDVTDPDDLYHIRHASIYVERGILLHDFPWTRYSIISQYGADIWYGFHLLLIPFTLLSGPMMQIKVAGVVLLTGTLVSLWWALRRLQIDLAWVWPFFFVYCSPMHLWRMMMVRPHVLTCGLGVLLLSFLVRGAWWQVGLVAASISFMHLNFAWLPLMIGLVVAIVAALVRQPIPLTKLSAIAGGCILGWLLRPNPLGAAALVRVNTVELLRVRQARIPLNFGMEVATPPYALLVNYFVPLVIIWAAASIWLLWRSFRRSLPAGEARIILWSGFGLSALFFEAGGLVIGRAWDFWVVFAILTIVAVWSKLVEPLMANRRTARAIARLGVLVGLVGFSYFTFSKIAFSMEAAAYPTDRLRAVGEWLHTHANKEEIVCNLRWADFPFLFYWNPGNRYIGGMDPIFQYAYSHDLYWKIHHLNYYGPDSDGKTCGRIKCEPGEGEDLRLVLRRDFHTRYLVLNLLSPSHRMLLRYCLRHPGFRMAFTDGEYTVIELVPSETEPRPG